MLPSYPLVRLRQRLLIHAPNVGMQSIAALPDLRLIRNDQPYSNLCGAYEPCVALIVQGRKRLSLGGAVFDYGPERYLIASMDLPVTAALLEASPERPYLAVALRLDPREIASLMLEAPPMPGQQRLDDDRALGTGAVTPALLDAFDRLLALLEQPADIAALAPLIQREIHYRLLTGDAGARLRQMATAGSPSQQIARAVALLNQRFDQPLRVDDLAREAGMGASVFHQRFKAHTAMSPLQYQKALRLSEARRLMLSDRLDAAAAAYRVGYESPSQFSREYARRFGAPPARDIAALRERETA
ncbi:AraC family transcriptional regulator [Ideonella sp. 4Y11]|uniref:AraC family transcriptional regulator n=1 Tax=Ideonella aquatica TaxID=2824119 RepID=A0A941BJH2_9BURK|nr:AraC family transcriptional regulator [Ideonella aquatica]MBQ0958873.1 AraC family transcriptional regulator [Ideonella aquatica]